MRCGIECGLIAWEALQRHPRTLVLPLAAQFERGAADCESQRIGCERHGTRNAMEFGMSKMNRWAHQVGGAIFGMGLLVCVPAESATPSEVGALAIPETLKAAALGVASSRVAGVPDAPPRYRVEPALPEHPIPRLITFRFEPGTGRLIYVHQPDGAKNSVLMRYDFDAKRVEKLLDVDEFIYGIEFHPRYASNGYLYLGTNGPVSAQRGEKRALVVRYTVPREGGAVDVQTGLNILEWPSAGHNGTALTFGSDGMLYVTSGDGTGDSDTDLAGQRLDHLLAKVLRIDVDHPDAGRAYAVPKDNPFVNRDGVRPETWAYGFRNPWRSSWDPKLNRLWVGQNGQDRAEQVYLVERGANYGWSVWEGSQPFYPNRTVGPDPVALPTLEHLHHEARSLTGGMVYEGSVLPELEGAYVYGDYLTGKIWAARHDGRQVIWREKIAESRLGLTDFVTTPKGELWVAHYHAGEGGGVYRVVPNPKFGVKSQFPKQLSETGLFKTTAGYSLEASVFPYSVTVPEWADGASIERHFGLPSSGGQIGFSAQRGWEFPEGSVVLQSFAVPDETARGGKRWIETRLLTRQEGEWDGYSYRWNDAQTDAELVEAEGAEGTVLGRGWRFASRAECGFCHSRAANFLLGLQTPQMHRKHDYGDGYAANQLEVLAALGMFKKAGGGASSTPFAFNPPLAKMARLSNPWDESLDKSERARSWLHARCAHCHVESGGGNSQIDLRLGASLTQMKLVDAVPLHGHVGLAADTRLVVPGDASKSVLIGRVARSSEGRMPPLGSTGPDPQMVRLLVEWISDLKPEAAVEGGAKK